MIVLSFKEEFLLKKGFTILSVICLKLNLVNYNFIIYTMAKKLQFENIYIKYIYFYIKYI